MTTRTWTSSAVKGTTIWDCDSGAFSVVMLGGAVGTLIVPMGLKISSDLVCVFGWKIAGTL